MTAFSYFVELLTNWKARWSGPDERPLLASRVLTFTQARLYAWRAMLYPFLVRVHNFNAGPAALPVPVLEQVQAELLDFQNSGMSIMEMSHRSKTFEAQRQRAERGLRDLLGVADDFDVLFLQGGATLQFSMAPMNLLAHNSSHADYLTSGTWGVKALAEAQKVGEAHEAASSKNAEFRRVPDEFELNPGAKYVHLTSNETIEGVQWPSLPDTAGAPIVADMSSDILSQPLDINRFGLIYAGAQKNIGPSGVTVVIIRKDWVVPHPELPIMLDYATHAKNDSLYNTPNTFGVYIIGVVCQWIEKLGGLEGMKTRNAAKAALLYDAIDASDFYSGFAEKASRSQMNVTFRLPDEALEAKFAGESSRANLIGLKGHRSVGGIRASLYNAVELDLVATLVEFMREFERVNG